MSGRIARLGAKRDVVRAQADARPHLAKARAGAPLPSAFDLTQFEPPRMDQGQVGACEGHGGAGATATAFAAAGAPLGFCPSPRFIYTGGRELERGALLTGPAETSTPLPDLTDSGLATEVMVQAHAVRGVIPMRGPTPDGRNSDIWSDADIRGIVGAPPANVNTDVGIGGLVAGAHRIVTGTHRIVDPTAADTIVQVQTSLAVLKAPLIVGTFVDAAFEQWSPAQPPIGAPNQSDPTGGGHCIYIVGYATNPDGTMRFLATNSWGLSWGDQGRCWVSAAWVAAVWDLYVWQVALAAASEAA